ncbi:MAG: hypothetical protein AAF901_11110 [Bacteroidota bacterium]
MRTLLSAIIIIFSLSASYAQDSLATTHTERIQFLTKRLGTELALSPDQKKEVNTLFKQRYAEKERSKGQSFKAMNSNALIRLEQILDKEQYQKYLKLKEERKRQKAEYLKDNPNYKFSKEDEELDF